MRLALAALLLVLGGCSLFMRSMEEPSAEVRDVSLSSAGLSGVTGALELDVSNPNAFGVPLSNIDWKLSIGGLRAVTGAVQLSQTIPARGVAPVTTSLTIDARDAFDVGAALARGARDYELEATLTFSTRIGPLAVHVRHRGQLDGGGRLPLNVLGLR